eukprot:m.166232 g.166232  ORF g.166232 m.166232 type:complete len:77 (+) comp9898_c0_seq6:6214-6444(+)
MTKPPMQALTVGRMAEWDGVGAGCQLLHCDYGLPVACQLSLRLQLERGRHSARGEYRGDFSQIIRCEAAWILQPSC